MGEDVMKFCSKKGKKRKLTKRKILNGVRGSISIFLCLLLTPFLSISLALIEYARYQEAIELTNEVYELSGISVLSDYDPYIHSRFGLLATAQEVDLEEGAEGVLTENIQVLGKQVTLENTKFSGKFPLKNNEVLKRQVVDFSELTSTTAVLLDDFHLQELLDKLDGLSKFQEVADTMDSLVEATEALSEAVEALEGLTGSLQELGSSVRGVISSATTLANDMANLYKRIGEDGIMLPKNATPEEVDLAVTSFQESYLEDFKELYATATELKENLSSIKPNLEEVKTSVTDFQEAVETARGKIQGIVSSSNTDLSQESESEETENGEIKKYPPFSVAICVYGKDNYAFEKARTLVSDYGRRCCYEC